MTNLAMAVAWLTGAFSGVGHIQAELRVRRRLPGRYRCINRAIARSAPRQTVLRALRQRGPRTGYRPGDSAGAMVQPARQRGTTACRSIVRHPAHRKSLSWATRGKLCTCKTCGRLRYGARDDLGAATDLNPLEWLRNEELIGQLGPHVRGE